MPHGGGVGLLRASARRARRAFAGRPLSVVTLALVVGAGSAVLAVANATLVRPLPFPDGHRLAQIYLLPADVRDLALANPLHPIAFVRLQEQLTLADGPGGAWSRERAISGEGDIESVDTADVSANFFRVLGIAPLLGRTFRDDEDHDSAAVVVLGHALWKRRFGGDPGVLGRRLTIDRVPHEIVGVMPEAFQPSFVPSQLWTPLGVHAGALKRGGATYIINVLRMRPGVTIEQLDAEVRRIAAAVSVEAPPAFRGMTAGVRTLRDAQYGTQRSGTMLLLWAMGALALIGVVNLAHLTLARAIARRPESALRLALGARARDLIRAEAIDAAILATAGGLAGLALAQGLLPLLLSLNPARSLPRDAAALDWRVLMGTFGLAVGVTLTAAVWPVWREARRDPRDALASGGLRVAGGSTRVLRTILIGAETALACVLVSSSLMLFSGFRQHAALDPGFNPDSVLGAQLRLVETTYASIESRNLLLTNVLDGLRAAPGVVAAATTTNRFIPGFAFITLAAPGNPPSPDTPVHTVQFRRVSDGYFETMAIPVFEGRGFSAEDVRTSMPVAVVSRLMADRFWPGSPAVGARLQRRSPGAPLLTVVGVVGDVSDVGFGQAPQGTLYLAYRQENNTNAPMTLVVRTAGEPLQAAAAVREVVKRIDAQQPVSGITTVSQFLDDSLGPARFRSTLLGVFAGLGLLLAGVGIYGVTARGVIERTREAGIRLALGGRPSRVWWTMASGVLLAVGLGVVAGLAIGRGTAPILVRLLPDLANVPGAAASWTTFAILAVVGAIAALAPARQAARVDPIIALRAGSSS